MLTPVVGPHGSALAVDVDHSVIVDRSRLTMARAIVGRHLYLVAMEGPLTEIPEHLLERTRSRRLALGLPVSGDDGGGAAPAGDSGGAVVAAATTAAALPKGPVTPDVAVETVPAVPAPIPPYIAAAESRRRIPYWALPVLALMPVWAFLYAGTLAPVISGELTPLEEGAEVYASNCATCHAANGGGGVGPALSDGAVLQTFESPAEQLRWIVLGSAGAEGGTYGSGRASKGGMPGFADVLNDEELLLVIRHERETLGGEVPDQEAWLAALAELEQGRSGLDAERLEEIVHLIEEEGLVPSSEEGGGEAEAAPAE